MRVGRISEGSGWISKLVNPARWLISTYGIVSPAELEKTHVWVQSLQEEYPYLHVLRSTPWQTSKLDERKNGNEGSQVIENEIFNAIMLPSKLITEIVPENYHLHH